MSFLKKFLLPFHFFIFFYCLHASNPLFAQEPLKLTPHPVFLKVEEEGALKARFVVEIADEPHEREAGLMFRTHLPQDTGMLFDFGGERMVFMWMKNTPLPLDMLFINAEGLVEHIAPYTKPYSTETIASSKPVRYVLEINAGLAQKHGVKAGDFVRHPLIAGRPR